MANLRVEIEGTRLHKRIAATIANLDPSGPATKATLFRIGTMVRNRAVDNLTKVGAIGTGRLRASGSFSIEASEQSAKLLIGFFGIKYARMVELGGPFTDRMRRAMFASFRERGQRPRPGKGVIKGGQYQGRPYLGPALKASTPEIIDMLKSLVKGEKS